MIWESLDKRESSCLKAKNLININQYTGAGTSKRLVPSKRPSHVFAKFWEIDTSRNKMHSRDVKAEEGSSEKARCKEIWMRLRNST